MSFCKRLVSVSEQADERIIGRVDQGIALTLKCCTRLIVDGESFMVNEEQPHLQGWKHISFFLMIMQVVVLLPRNERDKIVCDYVVCIGSRKPKSLAKRRFAKRDIMAYNSLLEAQHAYYLPCNTA